MSDWAIVVAAGLGVRMGDEGMPKAFRPLAGIPMYVHAIRAFEAVPSIAGIALVVPVNWLEYAIEHTLGEAPRAVVEITSGGKTRQESVEAGLAIAPGTAEHIVVHDAARPLVTPGLVEAALRGLVNAEGAVCAIPLADTLKRTKGSRVEETIPRETLWRAQTPQAFRADVLRDAHRRAREEGWQATDDAALVEQAGGRVIVVDGDERNIKVTTPAELELAEALLLRTKVQP